VSPRPAIPHSTSDDIRPRIPDAREYSHETLGERFERALSPYDTRRRVEVLIDEFLPDSAIAGKSVLDVGCGLGFFSRRLAERGALVTACDLGPELVRRTRERVGCTAVVADALALEHQFGPDRFDVVVSSECIEHTPDPDGALRQMVAVLRPGGYLSVSTPNVVWWPAVRFATAIGARPFDGLENFSSWRSIRLAIAQAGATIVEERGLHLFPFQLPVEPLSRWCDRHLQPLRGLMINICVLAQKLP
jgi:2-polyprenyl-6-hydroxyphenyl methylase/3-demethylubiquinone-9 3-methyltransferase